MNKRLWKHYFAGAALAVTLFAAPASAKSPNLLLQPGFTTGVGSKHAWSTLISGHASVTANPTSHFAHIHISSAGGRGEITQRATFNPKILLLPGHRYDLSGSVRHTGSATTSKDIFYQAVINAGFKTYGHSTRLSSIGKTNQHFSYTFINTASAAATGGYVILGATAKSQQNVFIDLSLTDLSAPASAPELDPSGAAAPIALAVGAALLGLEERKRADD